MMTVHEKILQLRKANGMSQEQLAESMNVSRQAISKWELGESNPDSDKVILLSQIFKVSTDYLLIDDINEYEKPTKPIKKAFYKLLAVGCGFGILIIGIVIGFCIHKEVYKDSKPIINSQLSDVDNLVADFDLKHNYSSSGELSNSYQFTIVPKVYVDNMTASIMIISNDGKSITKEATLNNDTVFSVITALPYNNFSVSVIFNDGYRKYTQGLMKNVQLQENGYSCEFVWSK